MDPDEVRQVSVSRDALRADLAEMELRLRAWLTDQMDERARHIAALDLRMAKIEGGDFTLSHQRAVKELVDERMTARSSQGWTARDRWLTIALGALAFTSFAWTIYVSTRGG